jgi:hypothetical protein
VVASLSCAAVAPTTQSTSPLSPYELHLLRNPSLLNSHRDALATAAKRDAEQAAARAHVSAFFEWMVCEALGTAPLSFPLLQNRCVHGAGWV